MTKIIFSALTVITMAISISLSGCEADEPATHQLTEEQQIEIYEQVMDECVLKM